MENSSAPVSSIVNIKNLRSFRDVVEISSKIIFTSIGLVYLFGFIILNNYLREYGVHYLNFLQIEYIMVGILFFILSGSTYLFINYIYIKIKDVVVSDNKIILKTLLVFV